MSFQREVSKNIIQPIDPYAAITRGIPQRRKKEPEKYKKSSAEEERKSMAQGGRKLD